jgi:hypothetical protein
MCHRCQLCRSIGNHLGPRALYPSQHCVAFTRAGRRVCSRPESISCVLELASSINALLVEHQRVCLQLDRLVNTMQFLFQVVQGVSVCKDNKVERLQHIRVRRTMHGKECMCWVSHHHPQAADPPSHVRKLELLNRPRNPVTAPGSSQPALYNWHDTRLQLSKLVTTLWMCYILLFASLGDTNLSRMHNGAVHNNNGPNYFVQVTRIVQNKINELKTLE